MSQVERKMQIMITGYVNPGARVDVKVLAPCYEPREDETDDS